MKTKEEVLEEFRIQSIREAATRVIARKGISGASMKEIAEEAGVAKGTLYLYFRNQQELLEAAVDQALTELLATLDQALDAEGSFADRLRLLIKSQLEFFVENHDLFQLQLATKFPEGADPTITRCDRASRPQYQSYMKRLTQFLREAIESGQARDGNPNRMATFIQEGVVAVLFQRLGEADPPPIEDEVEWLSDTILNGLAVKSKRSRS